MATLIESLTALAVFAIGSSVSTTWLAQSVVRTHQADAWLGALAAATELESRLRANPEGVLAGHYHYANPAPVWCVVGCTALAIAADDLYRFGTDIRRALGPGAEGSVRCRDVHCAIRIQWPGGRLVWGDVP
jgi:hypothetical protein